MFVHRHGLVSNAYVGESLAKQGEDTVLVAPKRRRLRPQGGSGVRMASSWGASEQRTSPASSWQAVVPPGRQTRASSLAAAW